MAMYYILYLLFVLFQGATNGAFAQFRGASQKAYNFLATVSAIGTIDFIVCSILHFFIIEWWVALILIIGTLLLIPTIGMRLGRKLLFIIVSPYLAIIFGIIFLAYQLYLMDVIKII